MKKDKTCCICGEPCTKKFQIEARKGTVYYFCYFHFQKYYHSKIKTIREQIKFNKKLLK